MFNKYYAKKVKYDDVIFDSEHEYKRYLQLKEMQEKGEISKLIVHPVFELQEQFEKDGKIISRIAYEADFQYVDSKNQLHIEDIKGFETKDFIIKKKLFEYCYWYLKLDVLHYTKDGFIPLDEYQKIKRAEKSAAKKLKKQMEKKMATWSAAANEKDLAKANLLLQKKKLSKADIA